MPASLPPPYSIHDLARLTGLTLRKLRRWIRAGLFTPVEFRGPATSYGPRHVEEIRAAVELQKSGLSLEGIARRRLCTLTVDELAHLAGVEPPPAEPLPPEPLPAAPITEAVAPRPTLASSEPLAQAPPAEALSPPLLLGVPAERWDRVVLLPGLELLVKADGSALLRRVAQEIYAQYGVA